MADDSVVVVDHHDDKSKIVTKFLLNTCQLLQPSEHYLRAISVSSALAARHPPRNDEIMYYRQCEAEINLMPVVTGSSAEFYIQPMLSCVGDIDIMGYTGNILAMPYGFPPPTELPAEFHSHVEVCEIVDCKPKVPGYVLLRGTYILTEDSDTGKFRAMRYEQNHGGWLTHDRPIHPLDEIHGPAVTVYGNDAFLSTDKVACVRCLWWPSQAADWPTRHRNYDWPDSATVDRVVSNGCDVVHVAHRRCRQDEFMQKYQWRLSFSRAEVVLLNSWMPVQQIVYHLLRVFKKTVRLTDITDDGETKIFSNYHLKTLMLWTCELKPQSWWIDDMNVVRICVKLLHMLADWLKNEICPHYFVNDCNVIYQASPSEKIANQFASITKSWLSTWFVNNYLRKCAQLCPDRVSRLFDDASTSTKLQNAVSAVVHWRLNSALRDLWQVFNTNEFSLSHTVSSYSLTVLSCGYYITELVKINSYLRDYFTAFALLHTANRIAKHPSNDDLLDILTTVIGQFVVKRRYCHQLSSVQSLNQAVILMKVVANNSRSTMQQIEFELSKAYLYRALRRKNSDSDSVYCLANVYLAVLYYSLGQYQTTIVRCTLVMRSQDHSQCCSHVVQGDLLPKVDDDIDAALGLAVFYQYVRTAAMNQQRTQHVVAFTTELFAHYLHIRSVMKCRHFTQTSSVNKRHRRTKDVVDIGQLLISDVLLLKSIKMLSKVKCHYKPQSVHRQKLTGNTAGQDTSKLVELLQQSAVEQLTTYRQLEAQKFDSVATFVTTDFEALYAYKRGNYERCLQLSTQNLRTLVYYGHMFPSVSTFPEFIQLMDDDIVSLTALILIVDPECRRSHSKNCIEQLILSLYLTTQCQMKLHHSVTSLVRTLRYIEWARRTHVHVRGTLNNLTLKLTERKLMLYLQRCSPQDRGLGLETAQDQDRGLGLETARRGLGLETAGCRNFAVLVFVLILVLVVLVLVFVLKDRSLLF